MFPEDFLKPGSTLHISDMPENPFIDSLESLISENDALGIELETIEIASKYIWLRDYFFPFENKDPKRVNHIIPMPLKFYRSQEMKANFNALIQQEQKRYFFSPALIEQIELGFINRERHGSKIAQQLLHHANEPNDKLANIEGGNTFSVYNTQGQKYILMGELSLLCTAAQLGESENYNEEKIHHHLAKTLSINPESLLVLPQANYHLDLQIAYFGEGKIALNDYSLCIRILEQMLENPDHYISRQELQDLNRIINPKSPSHNSSSSFFSDSMLNREQILSGMLEIAKKLDRLYGHQIEQIFTKLTEQQFTVIRVPGLFYYPEITEHQGRLRTNPIPIAQFINGLGGKDSNNSCYFLTANSPVEHIKSMFSTYLQNFGVDTIHYLGDTVEAPSFVKDKKGSLRCLTTMYLEEGTDLSQEAAPITNDRKMGA